jgi:hypothetical protein
MNALGIDVGSLNIKAVILNGDGPLFSSMMPAGEGAEVTAKIAMEEVIRKSGLNNDDWYVVATGIGGKSVSFSQQQKAITTCLARGVHYLLPTVQMVVDLGAETSTVLKINDRGRVRDWAGQDKYLRHLRGFRRIGSNIPHPPCTPHPQRRHNRRYPRLYGQPRHGPPQEARHRKRCGGGGRRGTG